MNRQISTASAIRFVVLLGVVSLLADITYEGARSISGPFLNLLGASAAVVGVVAGLGELTGYGLRLISGYLTDRTQRYWTIVFLGYAINLLSVPLLALAGRWETAALLLIAERFGKAIRTPARDAMLAQATTRMGRGWGFGLHEAMDQIGAVTGPSLIAALLFLNRGYRFSFAVLLIPALLALSALVVARILFPNPAHFEIRTPQFQRKGIPRSYWIYLSAAACLACGYADFPLIAFHLNKSSLASDQTIPLLYALAMGVDAGAALLFGRLFDRFGIRVLALTSLLSALFAPLVFLGSLPAVAGGMILWGIGMGAQESILRAAIADLVPAEKRGSGYGIFHAGYGLFWFAGSAAMGILYDVSLPTLILFSVSLQFAAAILFWKARMS